jgi:hypothetical protein
MTTSYFLDGITSSIEDLGGSTFLGGANITGGGTSAFN